MQILYLWRVQAGHRMFGLTFHLWKPELKSCIRWQMNINVVIAHNPCPCLKNQAIICHYTFFLPREAAKKGSLENRA